MSAYNLGFGFMSSLISAAQSVADVASEAYAETELFVSGAYAACVPAEPVIEEIVLTDVK